MNLKFKVFHKNMFSTKEVVFLDALASLDFTLVSRWVSRSFKLGSLTDPLRGNAGLQPHEAHRECVASYDAGWQGD